MDLAQQHNPAQASAPERKRAAGDELGEPGDEQPQAWDGCVTASTGHRVRIEPEQPG